MKTNSIIVLFILSVAMAAFTTDMSAQNELPSEEIEVVKRFEATLAESEKVSLPPPTSRPDTSRSQYEYNVSDEIPDITYETPQIRPRGYRLEPPGPTYRGFVRGGYGTPKSILGDLSYHLVDNDNTDLILYGRHESANDNKNLPNRRYTDNDGGLSGQHTLSPAFQVNGGVHYSYDQFYYYADLDEVPSTMDPRRDYKTFTANAGISNAESLESGYSYDLDLEFNNLTDNFAVRENNFRADFSGGKRFGDKHKVQLDAFADLTSLRDFDAYTLNNYGFTPKYIMQGRKFRAAAGVTGVISPEKFHVFPAVDVSYNAYRNIVIAFAGARGGVTKNNLQNLSGLNPFITQDLDEIRNTVSTEFYAGAKGRYDMFEYSARFGYSIVDDLALFMPLEDNINQFEPLYDNGNVIQLEGDIRAEPIDRLNVGVRVTKNIYSLDEELKAWHLPGFEGRLYANYKMLDNKLRLTLDLSMMNGIWYVREDGFGDTLNGLFDVSVGGEYYILENLGVFVQLNNLTGNNGMRWNNYPVIGFQGIGGVMARF